MPIGPDATPNGGKYPALSRRPIIITFRDVHSGKWDDLDCGDQSKLDSQLLAKGIDNWPKLKQKLPKTYLFRPLYRRLTPARIAGIVKRAQARTPSCDSPSFSNYFALDFAADSPREPALDELLSWKEHVEAAYVAPKVADPDVDPDNNPRSPTQWHLEPAPTGIDAKCAWQMPGGDGSGQEFIDLEGGWDLNHPDLLNSDGEPRASFLDADFPANLASSRAHGTKVLGVICMSDNEIGGVGIAPNLAMVRVISHNGHSANIAEAITCATDSLSIRGGGVLVIEASLEFDDGRILPVEFGDDVFTAIKLATDAGVTVIEAAGNGGHNLDELLPNRDSGAIMVGAASNSNLEATPANRAFVWRRWNTNNGGSNFGRRVDCFAMGERVSTADPDRNPPYSSDFGGTSSATAIVAGAALLVQGMAQGNSGDTTRRLKPDNLRRILSDPAINTHTVNTGVERIGVMPNLRAIAENRLGLIVPPLV